MTPIADMVRKLFEKGVDQEAILIAIEAAEQAMSATMSAPRPQTSADAAADRRRKNDRERKQRERDRLRKSADICGNPQTSATTLSLFKDSTKSLSLEREAPKRTSAGHRGQRLPEDWQPQLHDWAEAQHRLGARASEELAKFRDYWKAQPGQRGVKTDWDATWRNWTRRAAENGHGKNPTPGNPRAGSLIAELDRRIAASEIEEEPD